MDKKYYRPMVDTDFISEHKKETSQLNILVSSTALFWKEHEDYFDDISYPEIVKAFKDYLKLVENISHGLHSAFEAINEGREQKVAYPEIPPDIFLHDAPVKLGKLRWKIINQ
uniref:hypothetical protein n=1 Tax=Lentilactobacillus hilgardii TaxID=1588 RepID=UPI00403F2D32